MTEQNNETAAIASLPEEKPLTSVTDYEAKLEEVIGIVARVRHEINNPLTGVLGQAQLLLREELSEKARKRTLAIEELALRLRDIVGQLRQIQKPLKSSADSEGGSTG
jgi:signal transduction histidine kinase